MKLKPASTKKREGKAFLWKQLLERFMSERASAAQVVTGNGSTPWVPILHLGATGSLHRRDICDDVR